MTHANTLFYGDNLTLLRDRNYFPDDSVDLVYLDPPFNSNRSYNVLFRDESGRDSDAQITAFEDSWHWARGTEALYADLVTSSDERLVRLLTALVGALPNPATSKKVSPSPSGRGGRGVRAATDQGLLGRNQMSAYLVMMAARLAELHRVLKPTGSLYLHCDPTASHYLKLVLDTIFGEWNFRSEIVWKRTSSHSDAKKWARVNDTIFYYAKSEDAVWNVQYGPYDDGYIAKNYRHDDGDGRGLYRLSDMAAPEGGGMAAILPETGRPRGWYEWKGYQPPERGWRYSPETMQKLDEEDRIWYPDSKKKRLALKRFLNEMPGRPVDTNWADILPIGAHAKERLGYPTQKPLALLERIIRASSNPGDVVLDPFCGCGTAIDAAQGLGRRWLGIDITHLSVALMKYRLQDRHGLRAGHDYRVIGEPQDLAGARNLAEQEHDGRYQFQWWALSLVGARPLGAQGSSRRGRKGADGGVDGVIHFLDENKRAQRVVVQVKSGKVSRPDIGDLRGLLDAGAAIAIFITLEPPTRPMRQEAISAGYYESELWGRFPRVQILTIEDLLSGQSVEMPTQHGTFRQAPRAREARDAQGRLL